MLSLDRHRPARGHRRQGQHARHDDQARARVLAVMRRHDAPARGRLLARLARRLLSRAGLGRTVLPWPGPGPGEAAAGEDQESRARNAPAA